MSTSKADEPSPLEPIACMQIKEALCILELVEDLCLLIPEILGTAKTILSSSSSAPHMYILRVV